MVTINLKIEQADVYEEVAKVTDYTGTKSADGAEEVRDRILITDEDLKTLGRFWEETVAVANDRLKAMLLRGGEPSAKTYEITLEVSKSFDQVLVPSVQAALRSYFVQAIAGKWFKFSNKSETEGCFTEAGDMIEDALRKLYSRKRPTPPRRRPIIDPPIIGPVFPVDPDVPLQPIS